MWGGEVTAQEYINRMRCLPQTPAMVAYIQASIRTLSNSTYDASESEETAAELNRCWDRLTDDERAVLAAMNRLR